MHMSSGPKRGGLGGGGRGYIIYLPTADCSLCCSCEGVYNNDGNIVAVNLIEIHRS